MRKKSPWLFLAMFIIAGPAARIASAQSAAATWQWQAVDDSACGDGSPTGFGLNARPQGSRNLAVFFQGGGACRDYFECYILHTAAHLDGYDGDHFASDVENLARFPLVDRSRADNPFAAMHLAWLPYCTGDLHAGHHVADYGAYHLGGDNTAKYMEKLAARFPRVKNVWLVGFSAGGFGAVLNWEVAQQAFPRATVHVVDDSGLSFGDSTIAPEQWELIPAPDDCIGCQDDMSKILPYIAKRSPKSRVGWVSFDADTALPFFLSVGRDEFSDSIQMFAGELDASGLPNLAYFYARGENHVVSTHADEEGFLAQYLAWLGKMVHRNDDWSSERAAASTPND